MEEIRLTTGDVKNIANNGPQFVASGGLNPSSTDNGCAQSAGNGCDLMQQQEKFQEHAAGTINPCSVHERQQDVAIFGRTIFWVINEQLLSPNHRHLHQAADDARVADACKQIWTTWKASRTKHDRDCSNGKNIHQIYLGKNPPLMQIHLHPWRLTWTPNFSMLKRKLVLQTIISRLHVSVWECIQKKNASTCLLKMSFSQLMVWLSGLGCWFGCIGIPENPRDATQKKSTNRKCEKAPPIFHQHPPLSGRI